MLTEIVVYRKDNPEKLMKESESFVLSLQSYAKGGTYSENEKIYYKKQLDEFNQSTLGETIKIREEKYQKFYKEVSFFQPF